MIPIRDSQWRGSTPVVTRALLIANVLVFLFMLALNTEPRAFIGVTDGDAIAAGQQPAIQPYPSSPRDDFVLRFGVVPEFVKGYLSGNEISHEIVETREFRATGFGNQLVETPDGGINLLDGWLLLLTPLTAMFLHGGWLHIIGNMLFLWVFGDNVEDRLGRTRFALFYVACGYLAAAAQIWIGGGDLVPMIGASGAISGVLGAYLILFPRAMVQVLIPIILLIPAVIPAPLMIGFWFLTNLFNGVGSVVGEAAGSGGTAWFAHIGGFIAGIVLIYPFLIGRWRAPAGWIGPTWSLPPGMTGFGRRAPRPRPAPESRDALIASEIVSDASAIVQKREPSKRRRLLRLRMPGLRRRQKPGSVTIYRRFPPDRS